MPLLAHPARVGAEEPLAVRAALERLAAMLGIEQSEVTAIGDNTLDLDMITWAGTGVCVANGNDLVKSKADLVIGACEDEGVAEYLESLFA